jgi:hypothetical protein
MIQSDLPTALQTIASSLAETPSPKAFAKLVVDEPFRQLPLLMAELFMGFICLYILDENGRKLRLLAASDTEYYHLAVKDYPAFNPDDFALQMSDTKNDLVRAARTNKPVHTVDWSKFRRPLAAPETVRLNQASSGIAATYSYPLTGAAKGVMMFNYFQYADAIGKRQTDFMRQYTDFVSSKLAL